ncbi:ATP-binding cassette domain-containing protein [Candidatus Dependentiae bacterium]|nr:ATP-binding cassette domain-containing protein [Candidatus Dependentiae bacterium]
MVNDLHDFGFYSIIDKFLKNIRNVMSYLVGKDLFKNFYIDFSQKELSVLKGINVSFEQGKTYAIIGVSGSGKSTLMHLLGGLDYPTSGSVLFDNQDIFKFTILEKEKFLNTKLGFVFQFHHLIKELNVLENIILMGLIKGDQRIKCINRAKDLLKKVGMFEKINSYPTELSGGQQQRVAILRAIFNKPSFLLADEPTGDLDAQNAQGIVDLLINCQKEWGMGLIICTHDKAVYKKMNHVYRLNEGILKLENLVQ